MQRTHSLTPFLSPSLLLSVLPSVLSLPPSLPGLPPSLRVPGPPSLPPGPSLRLLQTFPPGSPGFPTAAASKPGPAVKAPGLLRLCWPVTGPAGDQASGCSELIGPVPGPGPTSELTLGQPWHCGCMAASVLPSPTRTSSSPTLARRIGPAGRSLESPLRSQLEYQLRRSRRRRRRRGIA